MPEKINNKDRKKIAHKLYLAGNTSQLEIAQTVCISKNMMSRWVKEGKWDIERTGLTVTREQQLQRLYQQIDAINEDIYNRDKKIPTSKEADIISKLANAIKKLEDEASISDAISVCRKIVEWIKKPGDEVSVKKAIEIVNIFNEYIKDNI